jgi:ornithine--oxo-acid transaminase
MFRQLITKRSLHFNTILQSKKTEKDSSYYAKKEKKFASNDFVTLPITVVKGKDIYVWDVEGKRYFDFHTAASVLNQGHCHPRLVNVMQTQCEKLTMTSRFCHTTALAEYAEYITQLFGYQRILPMNSGVEANDTAIKLARRWAYDVKGVKQNEARIVFPRNNFVGRSILGASASNDPNNYVGYGPYIPNFDSVQYNNVQALEKSLSNPNVAAYLMEPIQGERGVIIPDEGYLKEVRKLCTKYNVLMIADEVQTGLGRTGKMLCCDHENIRPDIVTLGKSLTGGMMPSSAVLANDKIMLVIKPGQHGSTFAGNPLACRVATEALKIIVEEKLPENSIAMGQIFRNEMSKAKLKVVSVIRGKGLFNAIVIHPDINAREVCVQLIKNGVLAKDTHNNTIRMSPPLTIKEKDLREAISIVVDTLRKFEEQL